MTATIVTPPVTTTPVVVLGNRHRIDDELWKRLVAAIVKDEDVERSLAERIMDQALGFLALCAHPSTTLSFSPSPLVDKGWHMFMLYSPEYFEWCDKNAGRYIHHYPSDKPGVDYSGGPTLQDTVVAMRALNISVDEPLWTGPVRCNCTNDDSIECGGGPPTPTRHNAAACGDCSADSGKPCGGLKAAQAAECGGGSKCNSAVGTTACAGGGGEGGRSSSAPVMTAAASCGPITSCES